MGKGLHGLESPRQSFIQEERIMPWNNNGGSQGGPWGQPPRHPQPPDVDKVIQMARERFASKMGDGKSWPLLLGVGFIFWMLTGIYVVAPDEEGVEVRFGAYLRTTSSGPHFHLPYPIEDVYKPKVTITKRVEIGYRSRNRQQVDVSAESLMLTGDENIIDIDLTIQYRIKSAPNYLFNVRNPLDDPDRVVHNAAETAIRQVMGRSSIDEALTTGKEKIQAETKIQMQEILDGYKSGIHIINVQLQQVSPPPEVVHAFKDVASAREDRERAVNEAQGYANDILPKAKGEAAKLVQEAEAFKTAKESRAKGDADRFNSLLIEYEKAKDITRKRLYLETMEEVFAGAEKVILDPEAGRGILPFLPLGRGGISTPSAEKGEAK